MPLDGLRAWIGEVERKLGMRTRVFLALAAIAIGGAGAGIYLAVDARDSAVSEGDVQALQDQLEARIDAGGAARGATSTAPLEAELKALQAEVEQLNEEGRSSRQDEGGGNSSSGGTGGGSSAGTTGEGPSGAGLGELIEEAKKQSEGAGGGQGGK